MLTKQQRDYQRWKRKGTTTQRGYGYGHQKLRSSWKPYVDAGMVECHAAVCLEELDGIRERDNRDRWILPGSKWHLGHTADRTAWTGPEHERCSTHDGAVRRNRTRGMARQQRASRQW
jgi:hypothetical protein